MLPSTISAVAAERRLKIRYPVRFAVSFRDTGSTGGLSGVGYTLNMSSSGLLFSCPHELKTGMRIELTLEWPSLLDSVTPLQLATIGRIVRAQGSTYALAFSTYQFRTMKRKQSPISRRRVELAETSSTAR
jgi:PilZ domain